MLSLEAKKNKKTKKDTKGKFNGSRSVPKIKMKVVKNTTNSDDVENDPTPEEYFIFENRIFPVVNSDERRTINRYFWTSDGYGKENKEFKDTGSTVCTGFPRSQIKDTK